ncbi:MAG: cobalamin-independent methionine synthase II family protein [Chloroflexi bacterium]|nr:cobalamin-independent methionine synthase II family protein [Chloroflexota bacterium]OJV97524.1 MAG: 5-methyltetrahydropteroyltriglutamate--homocysteine methyltransferase [Chloroflexi bacterium 54-19]
MAEKLVTTVVGSFPQPDWLVDRDNLKSRLPPRIRAREIWRVQPQFLEQAQDDATLLAIREMEKAGVDIISDGEIRRESYSNRFATALDGVDLDNPGTAIDRTGHPNPVPRITGPVRRRQAVEAGDVRFLRANTNRKIKITVPGPFTVTQQAQNDYYPNDKALALDIAAAINAEIKDLLAAGADVVQIDEPYLQARPEKAREYAIEVINRALEGIEGTTALHMCFGYAAIVHNRKSRYDFLTELKDCIVKQISIEAAQPDLDLSDLKVFSDKTIILGVLNLGDMQVETPEIVANRIRAALEYIEPERLILAPDCGMKYLPREVAAGKLKAMVEGARIVREELK